MATEPGAEATVEPGSVPLHTPPRTPAAQCLQGLVPGETGVVSQPGLEQGSLPALLPAGFGGG